MKINIKELNSDWLIREWDEPVDEMNRILGKIPCNTLAIKEPLHVDAMVSMIGNNIELKGKFEGVIMFDCDRCCENSSSKLDEKFHYTLVPVPENEPGEDEECEESPELSFYEGEELDLSAYVREQVMLALPVKLLCDEGCKGICTGCGANLNLERCSCSRENSVTKPSNKSRNKESHHA